MFNIRKYSILLLISILSFVSYGQKLTFSPEVSMQGDAKTKTISEVWSTYIESFNDNSKKADSLRSSLWYNGTDDILKFALSKTPLYRHWEQFTFSIRKADDKFYEINTMIRIIPATDSDFVVLKIYKVYAAEVKGKFKLLNYFDETKLTLNHYNGDDVEFYSSPSKNLDKNEINEAVEFIKNFKKLYNISNNNKIKGIVANTMDECWALLGVPYTVYRSEKTYSGYAMTSGMVLVTRPNHLHELIHGVMMPLYPDAPLLLHEGIATYYAGGARKDYAYHKQNLKKYIAGNPIDLSAEEIFYTNKEIEGETYLTNIVGAMIIEYTLKNYGHDKVLQLFGKTYPEEVFEELGIKDINNWLYDLINQ